MCSILGGTSDTTTCLWTTVTLGLAMIVVGRTGRPAWLVTKPIRGMTPDEIEDWIDVHADWDQVRRARRGRRDRPAPRPAHPTPSPLATTLDP